MSYISLLELPVTWLYPWCDLATFSMTSLQARKDQGPQFIRRHPVISFIGSLLSCFAGSLLTDLVLGLNPLVTLMRTDKVLLAATVWGSLNLSLTLRNIISSHESLVICSILREIYRLRKVVRGIQLAESLHPTSIVLPVLVGLVKGAGSSLMRPLTGLLYNRPLPLFPSLLSSSTLVSLSLSLSWFSLHHLSIPPDLSYPALLLCLLVWRLPDTFTTNRKEKVEEVDKLEKEEKIVKEKEHHKLQNHWELRKDRENREKEKNIKESFDKELRDNRPSSDNDSVHWKENYFEDSEEISPNLTLTDLYPNLDNKFSNLNEIPRKAE